jgi:toxin ParE1/3/4
VISVVHGKLAEDDLVEIWNYVAEFNEEAADRVLRVLDKSTARLGLLPNLGRPRPDLGPGFRTLVCEPYLIAYRIQHEAVEIVRYIHMRRELKDLV